ncbi:probable glutamate receptor isoform X2 [Zootermopsis nevadensis]|uniref:probable glutamate receptor isoform X2 n=1 Tax=Zootermopsis nevadensis TaxID=136037 RepID=UPI000B8ECC55|nr:probable glutamate receptor isoform X2 [Zootermopsis nevadensis]
MKVLPLCLMVTFCSGFNTDAFVGTVTAIKQHFRSRFVYLLHDQPIGLRQHAKSNDFTKRFSGSHVTVAVLSTPRISDSLDGLHCGLKTCLLVIPHGLQDIRISLVKISSKLHMSSVKWLLFLENNTSLEEFFTDINIPFDCEFLVAQPEGGHVVGLTEVYRVSPKLPLQTYRFGNWTPDGGLTWPTMKLYERRNHLHGITLKTGALQSFVSFRKNKAVWNSISQGFFMKLWPLIRRELNFSIHLYGSKDGDITEGFMTPDGFWTGVYGLLQRREVELAFLPITMTSSRIDIMDFTVPLMEMRTSVIIKEPDSYEMQWNSILVPFTWQLWIAVCVVMVLLIVCLATTHRLNCHYENVEDKDFGFMEAIFIVYAALCQQGHSDTPNSTSVRAVFVTSYLTGMFLLGCYSAAFITHLTLRDPVLPFTDFKGLLEDGSYRLGMALISAQLEYFKNSSNELLRDIYWKMIAPHEATLELTDFPGLQRLCYDRNYAHLASDYMLVLPGYLPQCSITLVPQAFYPGTMALATVKRSPYLGLLNYMLSTERPTRQPSGRTSH